MGRGRYRSRTPAPVTRVMSFNVQTAAARAPALPWRERREDVAATIEGARPHVAGLQEVVRAQLDFLAGRLARYEVVEGGTDNGITEQYNPILVDGERYSVLEAGSIWMSPSPDVPGTKGWDAFFGRVTTWARLGDEAGGGELVVLNTHLDHRGRTARARSADLLAREVEAWLARGLPVVVVGDFNSVPGSDVHARLLAAGDGLQDSWAVARPDEADAVTWRHPLVDRPDRRLDWVLASSRWKVVGASIVEHAGGASDHLPAVADLLLP